MSSTLKIIALGLPVYFLSLFVNHSPWLIPNQAPTSSWVDSGPLKLVPTPQYLTNKTDVFTAGATHMALLHNSLIRGFNSIYLQAPYLRMEDRGDFIGYVQTWVRFAKSHSDDEESSLFGLVEGVLDDKDVWAATYGEHEAFESGLNALEEYLKGLPKHEALHTSEVVRIMDTFREPFEKHLHSEVNTIAALAGHPNAPAEDSLLATDAAQIFKTWGKKTVSKAGLLDVVPFFLLNLDRTAEGGLWANWPPMPKPVRWGLLNVGGVWHGKWWKFASSDATGQPAELYTFQTHAADEAAKEQDGKTDAGAKVSEKDEGSGKGETAEL